VVHVELGEVVEQVPLGEVVLVGPVDQPAEEVIPWTVDVTVEARLADRFDCLGIDVSFLFLESRFSARDRPAVVDRVEVAELVVGLV